MQEQINIILTIITALLTGGFILLFIENQHLGSNVVDRYHFIMTPFMHRLTGYLRFISSIKTWFYVKTRDQSSYTFIFKDLLDSIGNYGGRSIMAGHDYPPTFFKAKDLEKLCGNINRIWYYWDDKHNYMYGQYEFESEKANSFDQFSRQYLHDAFPDDFRDNPYSIQLISDVSGKFYSDIWSPIKNIPYEYEYWLKEDKKFKFLSVATIILNIFILLLILLLRYLLPVFIFTFLTVISIGLFGYTLFRLLNIDELSRKLFR